VLERRRQRDAESRYRSLFDGVPVGLYRTTPAGDILDVNPALVGMLGFPDRESLLARSAAALYVDPEDRRRWQAALERDGVDDFEVRIHRHDGAVAWVRNRARVVRDATGCVLYYEGSLEDVTARRRAEGERARLHAEGDRRRRESELLAALARDIGVSLDVDKILQGVVEAARELCQSDASSIALREPGSAAMTFRHWAGTPHPSWAALRIEPGKGIGGRALVTGQPFRTDDYAADPRITGDYLEAVRADGLIADLVVPIRWEDRVEGLLYVHNRSPRPFTDADELVLVRLADQAALAIRNGQLFAAVRESEEMFRCLAEASFEGIAVHDGGRILEVNRTHARLFGYTPAEMVGMSVYELTAPETRDRVQQHIQSGHEGPYEAVGIRRDGSTFLGEVRAGAATYRGRPVRVVAIRDITERRRADAERTRLEDELRQAQKMEAIGRLAGGIAHDFNNLLTVVTGRCQLLLDRLPPADPLRRNVDLIAKTADRAAALIRQLLAFSRKQVLQPRVLDLNVVVAGMTRMLRRLAGEAIDLVTVLGPGLGRVRADPGQVEQVILNLVVNARDAMPRGGQATLETADVTLDADFARHHVDVQPGPYVMLAVRDTGVGMDDATLARLFEPFFTTKDVGSGTGLGLATVYGIVKQSGGHVSVESMRGRGTTFRIYLPRVEESADPADSPPAAPDVLARAWETVLLVEDEDGLRDLARELLEAQGYTVLAAGYPGEALLIGERHVGPIHLLLTDVVMPRMSGRELADRLAAVRPEMKVLYMSGYTAETVRQLGVPTLDAALLAKPFAPGVLTREVRRVLENR
jgi:PAS domain S-box-containing protein